MVRGRRALLALCVAMWCVAGCGESAPEKQEVLILEDPVEEVPVEDEEPFEQPTEPVRLRLVTWNMLWLDEPNRGERVVREPRDYELLREYVQRMRADVVGLQEVNGLRAVRTLFDEQTWDAVCEDRDSPQRVCVVVRWSTGFVIERNPDVTSLRVTPGMRNGLDVTLVRRGYESLRVLTVHLKSGCFSGRGDLSCVTFFEQVPPMEQWMDRRALDGEAFVVLGDFNRRLAQDDDDVWPNWDDGTPAEQDLRLAIENAESPCWDGRFGAYIDHVVMGRRVSEWFVQAGVIVYDEPNFNRDHERLSDHCPVWADVDVAVRAE